MSKKSRTLLSLLSVVVAMTLASFLSVPFYNWFCSVTGYGGTPAIASVAKDRVLNKEIKIRFDASKEGKLRWEFKPKQREMSIKIGETGLAFYEAYNPTDVPIAGQASYNVVPFSAGSYFTKIECFCFVEQILQPGERVQMPVSFYVDPEIIDDKEAKFVTSITLSYTFYEIEAKSSDQALNSWAGSYKGR